MIQQPKPEALHDEISLGDIIQFFIRKARFLGLTTGVLSAIAITLSLLQPKQYQKQLTLSVQPVPITLSDTSIPQSLPGLDVNQASSFAVTLLQNQLQDQLASTPKYDPVTQQISLTLKSSRLSNLTGTDSKILNRLETGFQKTLKETLEANRIRTEIETERSQQTLAQLENQIARTPNNPLATVPNPRLEGLEGQRASYVAKITALQFDRGYLEKAEKNLPEFTSQVISINTLTESEARQTRSPMKIAVLVIIASFTVAVIAAIIQDQVVRLRKQLSKQKFDSKGDI